MDSDELQERLVDFLVEIGRVTDALPRTRFAKQISDQLVRSGTSPMANYAEACGSESKRDLIHKLAICLKEIRESNAWLRLIVKARLVTSNDISKLYEESDQLRRILGKSVSTAKARG